MGFARTRCIVLVRCFRGILNSSWSFSFSSTVFGLLRVDVAEFSRILRSAIEIDSSMVEVPRFDVSAYDCLNIVVVYLSRLTSDK